MSKLSVEEWNYNRPNADPGFPAKYKFRRVSRAHTDEKISDGRCEELTKSWVTRRWLTKKYALAVMRPTLTRERDRTRQRRIGKYRDRVGKKERRNPKKCN